MNTLFEKQIYHNAGVSCHLLKYEIHGYLEFEQYIIRNHRNKELI